MLQRIFMVLIVCVAALVIVPLAVISDPCQHSGVCQG